MSASPTTSERELARLRWRCRRGMLELDLVLLRFLETAYPRLDAAGQAAFRALLELEDAVLLDLLAGGQAAAAWQNILALLKRC
ncbi:succinate dehydrogenase assembly factor 2 [Thiobacter aerophilum]|uniref:FAD assembly factor SdhE n=1 Tax=Thiobacter aerophilum TaxID=3121275 RepID=A0ABV0EAJ1_9BURK